MLTNQIQSTPQAPIPPLSVPAKKKQQYLKTAVKGVIGLQPRKNHIPDLKISGGIGGGGQQRAGMGGGTLTVFWAKSRVIYACFRGNGHWGKWVPIQIATGLSYYHCFSPEDFKFHSRTLALCTLRYTEGVVNLIPVIISVLPSSIDTTSSHSHSVPTQFVGMRQFLHSLV